MTTTEQPTTTALATREWTDAQLQQRIKANINARFGLQDATPPQLNIIFLLAKRWGLDPVNELTIYEGRPFITLDGRLQLMRRNPDYRGYRTRPLSRQEKEDWGYEPDDLVVECTVLTHQHGDVTERGCVRRAEIEAARARAKDSGKRSAPVGIYGPEIAEKRAIARASRAAFGQDVPDEDEVGYVIEERTDPQRVALNAAEYDRVVGGFYEDEHTSQEQPEPAMVNAKNHGLWKAYAKVADQARAEGLAFDEFDLPISEEALRNATETLQGLLEQHKAQPEQEQS